MRCFTGIALIALYVAPMISACFAILTDVAAVLRCPGCAETAWLPISTSGVG